MEDGPRSDAAADEPLVADGRVARAGRRRRSRRLRTWAWIVVAVVLVGGAGAGAAWLVQDAKARADAARAVSPAQQAVIAQAIEGRAETDAQIRERRQAYRGDLADWQLDESSIAAWQVSDRQPAPMIANPGGAELPGADPLGRAFLDGIGATSVNVVFDAGPENCGYTEAGSEPGFLVVGGCYSTQYRNWLFVAWDPGVEDLAWPTFVHEAMHWYQYQHYQPAFLAADRAGVPQDAYLDDIETDASCRAVAQHGIDAEEYAESSSPCAVDDWYEGWLLERIAARGVTITAPDAEAYEVSPVVRP